MDLTDREITLIRKSFVKLREDRTGVNPFGEVLYERVFALMPEARPLFRDDMQEQGMQFLSALHVLVDHLEASDRIDRETRNLGLGHAAFGVSAEMYGPMGAALIQTMRTCLGERFDEETEQAWARAYADFAERMVKAAEPTSRSG